MYNEEMLESIKKVEANRAANAALEPRRMTADEKEALLSEYHPDYKKEMCIRDRNPYMVEIANIREQCSWIHKEMQTATEKAVILGRAAIAKVHLNAPLTAGESPVTKRALVIGGGIAGIPVSYTHLDVYKRQVFGSRSFGRKEWS